MTTNTPRKLSARNLALRLERERRILAKAATPEGWGRKDFVSSHGDTFSTDAKRLVGERRLFPAAISGGNRYFATQALCDAFLAAKNRQSRGRPAGAGTKTGAQFGPKDKAFVPPGVKVQRAPTPPGRYEVAGPIVGGFMTDWHAKRGTRAAA